MIWSNKNVFLTGASSGIGAALAEAIAKRGARVALVARRAEELSKVAEACNAAGGTGRIFACDVTDAEAVHLAAEEFTREFGPIDILIANAGIGGNNSATRDYQPDAVKLLFEINILGAVNSVHAVLPEMLKRGSGHLVAISSLAGFRGLPRSAAYSASKAALTTFFESIRLDVSAKGIDVTIIQPGFIRTPLTEGRTANMPFLMELDAAVPLFLTAIENKKKFAAFPWQLASVVRAGRYMPVWLYDRIAGRARYRE